MAFQVNNQAIVAFKHLLGKSNTDVAKGVNNEFEEIGLTVTGANVWTDMISATPVTAVSANVAVAVSCDVVLDATSNGHALFAVWPITPPTGTDPKTGLAFTYGTGSLVNVVAGDRVRRAIPDSFGTGYLARPFYMGNAIPVGDQRDWIYQYNSGIFFQEDGSNESWGGSSYAHPDQIDLYVYIGKTVQDITAGTGSEWYASVSSIDCTPPVTPAIGDRYLICPGPSPSATGAWTGQEDTIAEYSGIGWIFTEPTQGGTVQIDDQPGVYYLYTGSDYPGGSWIQVPSTIVRIGVATGTDTYLATVDPPITAYSNFVFIGVFDNANTGPSTINVNGLGDIIVRKNSNGSLVDLDALDIRSGVMYMLVYDGTIFQLYTGDLGDFVPISGTDVGNPVNGDIEVAPGVKIYTTGSPSNPSIVFNLGHVEVEGSVMKYDINRHIDFDARTLVDKEYVDDRIIKHTLAVDRTITDGDMYTVWGNFTLDAGQTIDNDGRLVIINGTFIDNGTYNQGANGSLEIVSTNLDYILGIDNKVNGQDILWTDGTGNWVTGQSTTYFNSAALNALVSKEYVDDTILLAALWEIGSAGTTNIKMKNAGTTDTLGDYSVAWGYDNTMAATATYSFIGGYGNVNDAPYSVISGGQGNSILPASTHAFIGGGENNLISTADNSYSLIVGGTNHIIGNYAAYSAIISGDGNEIGDGNATNNSWYSIIIGGTTNAITNTTLTQVYMQHNAILNGYANTIQTTVDNLSTSENVIGGGHGHTIQNVTESVILGGMYNMIQSGGSGGSGVASAIIASSFSNIGDVTTRSGGIVVMGGYGHSIIGPSFYNGIIGGLYNSIESTSSNLADYSFIIGGQNIEVTDLTNAIVLGGSYMIPDKNNFTYVQNIEIHGTSTADGLGGIGLYTVDPTTHPSWGARAIPDKAYVDAAVASTGGNYIEYFAPGTLGVPNSIAHSLGTTDLQVQLWYGNKLITADEIEIIDANTIEVTFTGANPSGISPDLVKVTIVGL